MVQAITHGHPAFMAGLKSKPSQHTKPASAGFLLPEVNHESI